MKDKKMNLPSNTEMIQILNHIERVTQEDSMVKERLITFLKSMKKTETVDLTDAAEDKRETIVEEKIIYKDRIVEKCIEIPVEKIVEKYRVEDKTVKRELPRLSSVFRDKKDTGNILQIKAVDATANGAKLYLEQVVAQVLASQHILFEQEMEKKQTRLEALSDQLERVEAFLQELEGRIGKMDRQDPAQATVLAVEKGGFLRMASDLKRERYTLQTEMSTVVFYPTELLGVPHLPSKPIKPKRPLVLLLAGIFGLLLGIMAALLAEFVFTARQRSQMFNKRG